MFLLTSLSFACVPPSQSLVQTTDPSLPSLDSKLYLARLQPFADADGTTNHALQYYEPNYIERWGFVNNLNTSNPYNIEMMCHDVGYNCSASSTACSAYSVAMPSLTYVNYTIVSPQCRAQDLIANSFNLINMRYCPYLHLADLRNFTTDAIYVLECGDTCNVGSEPETSCGPVLHHYDGTACTFDGGLYRECEDDFTGTAACPSCQYPEITSLDPVLCAGNSTNLCCNGVPLSTTATTPPTAASTPLPHSSKSSDSVYIIVGICVAVVCAGILAAWYFNLNPFKPRANAGSYALFY